MSAALEWYHRQPKVEMAEKARIYRKRYRDKARKAVFDHYGHKCKCCGESSWEFLTIDHINGNGAEHRRTMKEQTIYVWLLKNGFPGGFRLLCFNCNCAIGFRGHCPHNKEKV